MPSSVAHPKLQLPRQSDAHERFFAGQTTAESRIGLKGFSVWIPFGQEKSTERFR